MLLLVVMLLLLWLVLMGFLLGGTIFFQGYIYTEPVSQVYWRAPAAGSALTAFLVLWIVVDYRAVKNDPDLRFPYGPIHEVSPPTTDTTPFPKLFVPPENDPNGQPREYTLTKSLEGRKVRQEYRRGPDPIPSRPIKVTVEENGQKTVFVPDGITLSPDGTSKGRFKTDPGQPLFYRDKKGRILREGTFERIGSYRIMPFVFGLILNFVFVVLWFVCLWLLLRYQWWHALGLALVFSAVMLLFVVAPMMSRAESIARPAVVVRTE